MPLFKRIETPADAKEVHAGVRFNSVTEVGDCRQNGSGANAEWAGRRSLRNPNVQDRQDHEIQGERWPTLGEERLVGNEETLRMLRAKN